MKSLKEGVVKDHACCCLTQVFPSLIDHTVGDYSILQGVCVGAKRLKQSQSGLTATVFFFFSFLNAGLISLCSRKGAYG